MEVLLGISSINGSFSMAMLNNQRVSPLDIPRPSTLPRSVWSSPGESESFVISAVADPTLAGEAQCDVDMVYDRAWVTAWGVWWVGELLWECTGGRRSACEWISTWIGEEIFLEIFSCLAAHFSQDMIADIWVCLKMEYSPNEIAI